MYVPCARRGSDCSDGLSPPPLSPPDQAHSIGGRILFIETERSTIATPGARDRAYEILHAAATTYREIASPVCNKPPVIPARPSRRKVISSCYHFLSSSTSSRLDRIFRCKSIYLAIRVSMWKRGYIARILETTFRSKFRSRPFFLSINLK